MNDNVSTALPKYVSLVKIAFRESLYYPKKTLSEIAAIFIRVGVLVILYAYAYRYFGKNINGISLQVACWSMAVYFILLSLNARNLFRDINDDIISGKIEMLVNKPIGYLSYKTSSHFGRNMLNGLITLIAGLIMLPIFIGIPAVTVTPVWAVEVVLLTILGLTLAYLLYVLIGLAAFWLNNAMPLYWITDKAILILGGSFIPVALFPSVIQAVARYSPFGATMFSTYIFYPNFPQEAIALMVTQLIWICVIGWLVSIVYKAAEKKLTINGG